MEACVCAQSGARLSYEFSIFCNNSLAKAQDCAGCCHLPTRDRLLFDSDIAERLLRRKNCLHALSQLAGSNTRLDRLIASLAVRLPRGQSFGLTTFPVHHTTGSGFAFSPVDICDDVL